ncbi:MAG: CDP-alcohol phosphatidyltransferase family protein [Myxococcota bacterium]
MSIRHLPNALSLFRLAMVPVLGALAWTGHAGIFLPALLLSLASDVLDGWLARTSGVTSETGAKLDSWGDLATYASLPLFAWWLWPDLLLAEARYLVCAVVAYALPIAVGFARFGRLTSYHTWLAKGTAVVTGAALFLLFTGVAAWPFHVAVFLLVLEAAEEIAITWVLPAWRTDVPSLWHAVHAAS